LECATRGFNLVLVALPGSHLQHLSQFIAARYGVQVLPIEKDLSEERSCYELQQEVAERGIGIQVLINNAGLGGTYFFDDRPPDYYSYVIRLNVMTPTLLCRLFLPQLRQHAKSYILNISSLASFFYLPRKQVYGGTKAYILMFSKCLRQELKEDGVSVSVLCPGGVNTNWKLTLQHRTTDNWLCRQSFMNPDAVAAIAIRKMLAGSEVIIPGRCNKLFQWCNCVIPAYLKNLFINRQMKKLQCFNPVPVVQTVKPHVVFENI
jgi:short-subunit dehydrogenase